MPHGRQKILVVDDGKALLTEIVALLKRNDYEVVATASNGKAAIQEAARHKPDLVLMDIMLGGEMDGIQAGREIHTRFDIPVIYLTACADERTLERAKVSDPFGYVIKPFAERELCVTIEMALYRHQAEKKMMERERWFEAMLRCIGDAIVTTDLSGNVASMNPLAESLTGWKSGDAVGRGIRKIFHLIDEKTKQDADLPEIKGLLHTRELATEDREEVLLIARDGKEHPVSYSLSLIRDAKNKVTGMALAFRDITRHREMEKQILAKQKMEAIGKMASTISHEFNTLLTIVAGCASSMTEHLIPNTRVYDDAQKIIEATRHAGVLTKRILGLARATSPDGEITIEPMPLPAVVRNTVALVESSFGERHITVEVKPPAENLVVMADSEQFLDVLTELLMNAADAMPEGGRISIDMTRKRVLKPDPRLNPHAKPGRYGVLRIRDTGRGISAEVLEHIFEPFFSTKDRGTPIGLGLSVAQSAIQHYGGWIKASSKPWRGTAISLFIPEAPRVKGKAAGKVARPSLAHILVVDDCEKMLAETRTILESAGHRVTTAAGGEEAISLIRQRMDHLDLFLVDVVMPGKDGKEVLQAILDRDATATVIMASGFSRDYVRSILPPGAWKFVQKPFDRDQLLGVVTRALAPRITPSS